MSETGRLDAYEEKLDEVNRGLLTAYAAGFSQAVETFDLNPDFDTDVESLRENDAITEGHYYLWDGRTKPLEFWLREQFGLEGEGGSIETLERFRQQVREARQERVGIGDDRGASFAAGKESGLEMALEVLQNDSDGDRDGDRDE